MHWTAPHEKDAATETLEKRLWAAADQLRANSGLTSAQHSQPVLGLILRFAEVRFLAQRETMTPEQHAENAQKAGKAAAAARKTKKPKPPARRGAASCNGPVA